MRVIVAAGTTETALIDGISAAGAAPELLAHTPAADAEIVVYGEPTATPVTPVSPSGCPTPATATRAVCEMIDVDVTIVDAGLAEPTAAPTVDLGAEPGADIRKERAVPAASSIFDRARRYGASLPDDEILLGETVPGGTTTALGVLTALDAPASVSSSLPTNPIEQKRRVVREGLTASGLGQGDCAGEPLRAIEAVGDPVQAAVMGIAAGAIESGTDVRLAGGTQMVAIAALLAHAGVDRMPDIATTVFVADEQGDQLGDACGALDCELVVTDPGFDRRDHVAMNRYCAGEAKEGVAMGGALSLVPDDDLETFRDRFEAVCARVGIGGESQTDRQPPAGAGDERQTEDEPRDRPQDEDGRGETTECGSGPAERGA